MTLFAGTPSWATPTLPSVTSTVVTTATAASPAKERTSAEILAAARAAIERNDPAPALAMPSDTLPAERSVTQPLVELRELAVASSARPPSSSTAAKAFPVGEKVEHADGFLLIHERRGQGLQPRSIDFVRFHYTAMYVDGSVFATSTDKAPHTIFLAQGLPCWIRALGNMQVGGRATVVCPPELAFGTRGMTGVIPPETPIRFDLELLDVIR